VLYPAYTTELTGWADTHTLIPRRPTVGRVAYTVVRFGHAWLHR